MKTRKQIMGMVKNIIILFLLSTIIYLGYNLDVESTHNQKSETQVVSLAKSVLTNPKIVKGLRDTFTLILNSEKTIHDSIPNPPITLHDTLDISRRLELHKLIAFKKEREFKDSIAKYAAEKDKLAKDIAALKEAKKNISFQNVTSITKIDSNADIVVSPFKKKERQNIFSPQKNFMRVYNKFPGGKINGLPYYDYEQTNDELNLLLFQVRTAYNFNTGLFSYGPGVELKIDRFSINGAALFNSSNDPFKRPTVSLGARYDLYRIRFK